MTSAGAAVAMLAVGLAACARSHGRDRPHDAGLADAGAEDSGVADSAGRDGGHDAGHDAGHDGGPCGRFVELQFTPAPRLQIAIWLEGEAGVFRTLYLTEAVGRYGIGNRPGAVQMNSGYRWPLGRREGVLPAWAHRREASGARLFPRVVFQAREEGFAGRSTDDSSPDRYFCMYFDASRTRRDSLDAITCGSIFAGDKGRYLTADDIARGYAEPFEEDPETGVMRPLDREARYPPRRDVVRCSGMSCFDHPDVDRYDPDARTAMPELDAVTFATPQGDEELTLLLPVPDDLPSRDYYVVWLEVNSEGDYGGAFESVAYPTPDSPTDRWDYWALAYGYPYRGQPSVVFQVPVGFDAPDGTRTSVTEPLFYTSVHGLDAELHPFGDGAIVDDSEGAPGSGADRLRRGPDRRRLYAGTRDLPCR